MKNKGFTLIELIAVIVMMGMILLIVFPATSRILKSNEDKKYDTYYDAVGAAIERYARTRRDELGGISGEGCTDDKTLSDLLSYEYIKKYEEEKDVTCLSPGDFSSSQLSQLGIDTSKHYINVRISNKNGKVSVKYSMICVRNYDEPSDMSLLYSNLIERNDTCSTYVPEIAGALYNVVSTRYATTEVNTKSYISGSPNNNYVWYSGKLWRIVEYDSSDRTIKLVTNEGVALATYNNIIDTNQKTNNFSSSNIYYWLQNVFLPTLRNPEKFLEDAEWECGGNLPSPQNSTLIPKTVVSKVGMLTSYEYNQGKNYLNNNRDFWLMTPAMNLLIETNDKALYVNSLGEVSATAVTNFFEVRPSVVLKPNITFVNGGNGTRSNPFKLVGDTSANIGTPLNNRFSGEYVSFNDMTFRISSTDSKYTKLIATDTIPIDSSVASTFPYITSSDYNATQGTIGFHYYDKLYSDNTYIGEYLKSWIAGKEEYLDEADFCRMYITSETSQTVTCPTESVINTNIAIPKVGELFATNKQKSYWTINNYNENKVNVILPEGTVNAKDIDGLYSILPVVVIKNSVLITGGTGSEYNPYTIE